MLRLTQTETLDSPGGRGLKLIWEAELGQPENAPAMRDQCLRANPGGLSRGGRHRIAQETQHRLCAWLPLLCYSQASGGLKENACFWLSIQTWQVKILCFHGNRILTASNKGIIWLLVSTQDLLIFAEGIESYPPSPSSRASLSPWKKIAAAPPKSGGRERKEVFIQKRKKWGGIHTSMNRGARSVLR